MLLELYETEYKIHDHIHTQSPLASVKFNNAEKYLDHYLFEGYLELFLYKKIHQYTGISFDDFISRTKYEIDKIVSVVESFITSDDSAKKKALDDLQNGSK